MHILNNLEPQCQLNAIASNPFKLIEVYHNNLIKVGLILILK